MKTWAQVDLPKLPANNLPVKVFDTASEGLVDVASGQTVTSLYVCGITPYDATHIGHAATYLTFDLLIRALRANGKMVRYVQNVTDVDDPLLERANQTGEDWRNLAFRESQLFQNDMTALRVIPPNDWVAVTEAMPVIVDYIENLLNVGAAYKVEDDLYFDISKASTFGYLSHLSEATMLELSAQRGGDPERQGKLSPLDALLWRAQRDGEPFWSAPFGNGRPGWHVECLAIAAKYLGNAVDVQGGGSDLIFPHHEYCLAESVSIGDPFAKAFVHAGMVSYQGAKMSKSLGNLVLISQLRESGKDPMAIRLAIINNHYRQNWQWEEELLVAAELRLARWRAALSSSASLPADSFVNEIQTALATDLDTPRALRAVDEWASQTLNGAGFDESSPGLMARALDALLGIAL